MLVFSVSNSAAENWAFFWGEILRDFGVQNSAFSGVRKSAFFGAARGPEIPYFWCKFRGARGAARGAAGGENPPKSASAAKMSTKKYVN